MWTSDKWKDYELIDCGDGQRFERWGEYLLVRPDPQAIWTPADRGSWRSADARYVRSASGGGHWEQNNLPQEWQISYDKMIKFKVRPMNFKHTGVFPEQAANWDFIYRTIKQAKRPVSVLNLFAYTGGATLAAAAAGASVCHVDAAKNMVACAKDNAAKSGLAAAPIRYIVDDCKKFIEREIRRGHFYDAIIMDPPSYGRGPSGEIWKLEDDIFDFVKLASGVLSDNALFFILNSYTTGLSAATMGYVVSRAAAEGRGGAVRSEELGLKVTSTGLYLPAGAATRWCADEKMF